MPQPSAANPSEPLGIWAYFFFAAFLADFLVTFLGAAALFAAFFLAAVGVDEAVAAFLPPKT